MVKAGKSPKWKKGAKENHVSEKPEARLEKLFEVDEAAKAVEAKIVNEESPVEKNEDEVEEPTMETPEASDDDEDSGEVKKRTRTRKRDYTKDSDEKNARTIFVGNLPTSASQKDLMKLFSEYGKIESVRLRNVVPSKLKISKKIAAQSKKFIHEKSNGINAYVVFKERDSAINALAKNSTKFEDRTLRVDGATHNKADNSKSVFVGSLPLDVKDDALREFFQPYGKVEAVRVVRDAQTGIGKGIAFVTFASADSVMMCIEKDGTSFCDRQLRIKRVQKSPAQSRLKKKQNNQYQKKQGDVRPRSTGLPYTKNTIKKSLPNKRGAEGNKVLLEDANQGVKNKEEPAKESSNIKKFSGAKSLKGQRNINTKKIRKQKREKKGKAKIGQILSK
ncbi:RNA-binding protein 34 [Halotydeus destructor]|nr:RNA-binding protein 34 [Halotydeus destructor]